MTSPARIFRLPELLRTVLLMMAFFLATSAAVAPVVYLLRRVGVG